MNISAQYLTQLRAELAVRDSAAMALGKAVIEYEGVKAGLSGSLGEEQLLRLGAIQNTFDTHRALHLDVIAKSSARQTELGVEALAAVGLKEHERNFNIDLESGEIREQVNGTYLSIAEEE